MDGDTLPKQAVVVVNVQSRRGAETFEEVCDKLGNAGIEVTDRHAVEDPDQIRPIVQDAISKGAKMLIVGGGDGSISSTIDDFLGTETVFALLPLGTANSFARTLGIPLD